MQYPFVIVLDNIRSALNVGAIFRTCDGAGISKLYLCGITPYPPHNRIPKTALGAVEYVEWERATSTIETITKLKAEGYKIYSIEQTEQSIPYTDIEYTEKSAFVFGHEISGVADEVLESSDQIIELPMHGKKNSLNVATTAGIISYHAAFTFNKAQ